MISIKTKLDGVFFSKDRDRIMKGEYNQAMHSAVILTTEEVVRLAPVGVTGFLSKVQWKVVSPFHGVVGSHPVSSKYALVVEVGRKPGKFPPPEPIRRWLQITDKGKAFVATITAAYKIKKKETALRSATFLKSRGIARQGTKGAFMFQEGEKRATPRVNKLFERAVIEIARRLSG